jgi:hypothetical protein
VTLGLIWPNKPNIYLVLHKIAFQYYPLDLSATSNPFLISWWPLALGDPALFHVSLQTACLDEELLAQKGFQLSELLMADSVALLRRKVEDVSLAVQDGTMNSVITLATIEVSASLDLLFPFETCFRLVTDNSNPTVREGQYQGQPNAC